MREIMEKLQTHAPVGDVKRLISLELASIMEEREQLANALVPNQVNLRRKEVRRSFNDAKRLFMGVRILGKFINETHKRRDYIDWHGEKFSYVLNKLVELAIDCFRKTGQREDTVQNWLQHYSQQLDEKLEEICKAANSL